MKICIYSYFHSQFPFVQFGKDCYEHATRTVKLVLFINTVLLATPEDQYKNWNYSENLPRKC